MTHLSLRLTVTAYRDHPPAGSAVKVFTGGGGRIGRDADNDWVLPDPALVLSRSHAALSYQSGNYFITDTSRNGVFVNDRLLGKGNQVKLAAGDRLRLGDYEIRVDTDPVAPPGPFAPPDQAAPAASSPRSPPAPSLPPAGGEAIIGEGPMGFAMPPDWFGAEGGGGDGVSAPGPAAEGFEPQREALVGRVRPPSRGGDQCAAAGEPQAPEPPPKTDWPSEFAAPDEVDFATPSAPPEAGEPAPGAPSERPEAPLPSLPAAVKLPAPAATPAMAPATTDGARAFLHGAGIPSREAGVYDARTMEQAGRLFRRLVEGTMEALTARTRVKQELQLERTQVRARGNNPLKFLATPEEAVRQLLRPRLEGGYLPSPAAIDEAFDDLEAHQAATLAGMQAALRAVFTRFDPASLEAEFAEHAGVGALIPLHRKARCWDLFNERFETLTREAEENFQQLFGREFAAAYRAQSERLQTLRDAARSTDDD